MVSLSAVVCLALLGAASATDVEQCPGLGKSLDYLESDVQLSPCKKAPCRLKKGTNQHITVKFTPKNEIADLENHVTADVLGVNLPFPGVDGVSICDKLFTDSGEKASCPLAAGTNYTYKDHFPIHSFYPSLRTRVHWELKDEEKELVCFEVEARIQ